MKPRRTSSARNELPTSGSRQDEEERRERRNAPMGVAIVSCMIRPYHTMQLQGVFSHRAQYLASCAHVSSAHLQRRPLKTFKPTHADNVALRHCKADARSLRRYRSVLQHVKPTCTLRTAAAGTNAASRVCMHSNIAGCLQNVVVRLQP